MILGADCISEHVLNGNMNPQGDLCYFGWTLEERRGSHDTSKEKEDKKAVIFFSEERRICRTAQKKKKH